MNELRKYFQNIGEAISTTISGMKITLRYWVKEPAITIEYPDRLGPGRTPDDLVSERYRGFLAVDLDTCIACMQCMRSCPIDCIGIDAPRRDDGKWIERFDIDQACCMHCGLCVEACPTGAVHFTKRFEGACFDIRDLLVRHVDRPVPAASPRGSKTKTGAPEKKGVQNAGLEGKE